MIQRFGVSLFFLFVLRIAHLSAQDPLNIDTTRRCVFTGSYFGEELYYFRPDPGVEAMITRILDVSDKSRNFKVVNTNVTSVAAVATSTDKYLLYNSDFFDEYQADTALRFALLAHEVAHLVNDHSLSPKKRLREESEADQFVGVVMFHSNFPLRQVLATADFPGYSYDLKPEERRKILRRAWELEDARLRSGENAGYLTEEKLKSLPLPRLPWWPPPQCARRSIIDNTLFSRCRTLADVDGRLSKALDDAKYGQRSYYWVPNGYAVVTQFEQYKADGSPMPNEADRWKDYPVPTDEDWTETFKRFFTGYTGNFRIFVFIVTDQAVTMDTGKVLDAETGRKWLMSGGDRLPEEIGRTAYLNNHRVTLLVYEFEAKSSTNIAKQRCPGKLEPPVHLEKAGIKKFIKKC